MTTFDYTIKDELGIYARPAGLLVKEASKFASTVTMSNGVKNADAKKIMAIMMMAVKQGQTVTFTLEGEDEEAAALAIEAFMNENL